MRSSLFCDLTQSRLVVSYWHFETICSLKMSPLGSETSVTTKLRCVTSQKSGGFIHTPHGSLKWGIVLIRLPWRTFTDKPCCREWWICKLQATRCSILAHCSAWRTDQATSPISSQLVAKLIYRNQAVDSRRLNVTEYIYIYTYN
jgi:hypothetical protein